MTHDPKLVEAACAVHWAVEGGPGLPWDTLDEEVKECRQTAMRAAIDAINTSGTHWVAPWGASMPMKIAGGAASSVLFARMRDAYLAKQKAKP